MVRSILEDLDIEEIIGGDFIDDDIDNDMDAEDDLIYADDGSLMAVLMTDPEYTTGIDCDEGCY